MEFGEYPLLNTPQLMLILLKVGVNGAASLDDAERRLQEALEAIGERLSVNPGEIRQRLGAIRQYLTTAGLLEPAGDDRVRTTERGLRALAEHPAGFDTADLMQYAEFRRFIRKARHVSKRADLHVAQFDEGYYAYESDTPFTDNPYPADTIDHLAWEDGWFEARDEDGKMP